MKRKKIPYELVLVSEKPAIDVLPIGYTITHLPLLKHKENVIFGPLAIAEYLEKNYPTPPLSLPGTYNYEFVLNRTSNFWPALRSYIVNRDKNEEHRLCSEFERELDIVDHFLKTSPGQFICGIDITIADLYIIPRLFQAMIALKSLKNIDIINLYGEKKRPALENYMLKMFQSKDFDAKQCTPTPSSIINAWKEEIAVENRKDQNKIGI